MKKPLQLVQTVLATSEPAYAVNHPCVRHNPLFLESLSFEKLCEICKEGASRQNASVGELLIAYVDHRNFSPTPQIWYWEFETGRIVRTEHDLKTIKDVFACAAEWSSGTAGGLRHLTMHCSIAIVVKT